MHKNLLGRNLLLLLFSSVIIHLSIKEGQHAPFKNTQFMGVMLLA